jgi:hypothetical protein
MIMATMGLMAGKESEVGWSLGCNKFMGDLAVRLRYVNRFVWTAAQRQQASMQTD